MENLALQITSPNGIDLCPRFLGRIQHLQVSSHIHLSLPSPSMTSEDSPLLSGSGHDDHELVYQRFSPLYKRVIVAIVSWCALIPRTYIERSSLLYSDSSQRLLSFYYWNILSLHPSNRERFGHNRRKCQVRATTYLPASFLMEGS